jgi:hypothetical protein
MANEFKLDEAKALEVLKLHGKNLAADLLVQILEPALKNVVASSENKFDDAMFAIGYEPLKAEMLKLIKGL